MRAALDEAARASPALPANAVAAFGRLVDVLESSPDAVVFAAGETVTAQEAAVLLGVGPMTIARLIDRGELTARGGAAHRRIPVAELARYQADSRPQRRAALAELTEEIGEDTPPDQVISTR